MPAEATIRLRRDPETGELTMSIAYTSDPDALPIEHEQDHRALVEGISKGISGVRITRGGSGNVSGPSSKEELVSQGQALGAKGGG